MSGLEEKTPGLLLQAIPYLGQKKILKIFTPGLGLISLMCNRVKNTALTSPFCIAEWVYRKNNRDIHPLIDASLSDGLLDLRKNYSTLTAAGQIAHDLTRTQLPGKHSPELFALSCSLFQKLPTFDHPELLVAFFRLKFLTHEGLLSLQPTCSLCASASLHLSKGESFCLKHAPFPGWTFSTTEWEHLAHLAQARNFSSLREMAPHPELYRKVLALFDEFI